MRVSVVEGIQIDGHLMNDICDYLVANSSSYYLSWWDEFRPEEMSMGETLHRYAMCRGVTPLTHLDIVTSWSDDMEGNYYTPSDVGVIYHNILSCASVESSTVEPRFEPTDVGAQTTFPYEQLFEGLPHAPATFDVKTWLVVKN